MTTIDGVYSLGSELLQSETPEFLRNQICGKTQSRVDQELRYIWAESLSAGQVRTSTTRQALPRDDLRGAALGSPAVDSSHTLSAD